MTGQKFSTEWIEELMAADDQDKQAALDERLESWAQVTAEQIASAHELQDGDPLRDLLKALVYVRFPINPKISLDEETWSIPKKLYALEDRSRKARNPFK